MWYNMRKETEEKGDGFVQYRSVMEVMSQCNLGAAVINRDGVILEANGAAERLLHCAGLAGRRLGEIAPSLLEKAEGRVYASTAFGEYLLRIDAPEAEGLPAGTELLAFRDASLDACHDMLLATLNKMKESVVICDAQSRMYLLNDAAVKLDSMVTRDVLGESLADVYEMLDGEEMAIPWCIREKKPKLDHRQYYATRYGRTVNTVSNTWPIVQNGQVLGAFNILEDWSEMDHLHKQIIELQGKLTAQTAAGKKGAKSALTAKYKFRDIIHTSPRMSSIITKCRRVAKSDSSVMIYGETGSGKELFVQSLHNASARADGPFIAINCAALPENLLEGLLFGTEKGAYTGAEKRAGLFEQANHGTLFLDELNSMNVTLQAKLLRVLQDGVIRRLGGTQEIQVDVRVLSALNIPPYQAIAENKLRQDLYYRLGVVSITIPPLRERKEDIPLLSKHFIMNYSKSLMKNVRNIDQATLEKFQAYDWPGNVRELQHAIEHAMNILPEDLHMITPEYIPDHISAHWETTLSPAREVQPAPAAPRKKAEKPLRSAELRDLEQESVCQALREAGGNISQAARSLGLSRQNLQYRIKRYGIDLEQLLK